MGLSCKLCKNKYNANERSPVTLTCGHSFCRRCMTLTQPNGTIPICPTCGKNHSGLSLADLPTTFDLLELDVREATVTVIPASQSSSKPEIPFSPTSLTAPTTPLSLSEEAIHFYVKTSTGCEIPIKLRSSTKINDLKLVLQSRYGLNETTGSISFEGNELDHQKTLRDYGITSESQLYVDGAEESYDILRKIGQGGFATVYLINKNGQHSVLKKVDLPGLTKKNRELAIQEMKLIEDLQHPNIVAYEGGYKKDNCLHIFMEHCSAGDLGRQITRKKDRNETFTEEQILMWTRKIVEGLMFIHDRNIIHRDIKPANIFLTDSGVIKIGDFGISRVLGDNTSNAFTEIGTMKYTAIEVLERNGFTTKADLFSLGCTVYELANLEGNYPYIKVNLPDRFSHGFKDLVGKLLQHNPDSRPSAPEMLGLPIFKNMKKEIPISKHGPLQDMEHNLNKLQENPQNDLTIANLKRSIEEETLKAPTPKLRQRKRPAPPVPLNPATQTVNQEYSLEILDKFCHDCETGHISDKKQGVLHVLNAMEMHKDVFLIQMKGCYALSYISIETDKHILSSVIRRRIVYALITAMEKHEDDWDIKAVCCQSLQSFARRSDLLLKIKQLVPQLLKVIQDDVDADHSWTRFCALLLMQVMSFRVGQETRSLIANLGTMEVISGVIEKKESHEMFENSYKTCWSIICSLMNENPVICQHFVEIGGLSLIQRCLFMYLDIYPDQRGLWIALSSVSEVKELRHHLQNKELLDILLNVLELASGGNDIGWDAAYILVNILSDGESAWTVSLSRYFVIRKVIESMKKWDKDSEPNRYFRTLKPMWTLLKAKHTPICQFLAVWTIAKLTKMHRDTYCPLIIKEGGLIYLQQLKSYVSSPLHKSRLQRRISVGLPDTSVATVSLVMKIREACDDYKVYGTINHELYKALINAVNAEEVELVEDLIESDVDINCTSHLREHNGKTPIHLAATKGNAEILCALLDAGAFIDAVDKKGLTALHMAAGKGHLILVELLLIYGSDIHSVTKVSGWKCVHFAAAGGHIKTMSFLSTKVDINELTRSEKSSLHLAAEYNQKKAVEWLLEKGLNSRHKDTGGRSALDYATLNGNSNIVTILKNVKT